MIQASLNEDRRPRSRREGSALVLVMLVMMMMTAMVLVLLQSAETSHKQSKELAGLSQATAIADAGMRRAVLRLASGDDSAVTVTNQTFGGGKAFTGQYDYRTTIVRTSPSRIFRIEAEGRVRMSGSGASDWTRAGVQVYIEEVVTGNPPQGDVAGALTVLSETALPRLDLTKSGNPPEITGNDHTLDGDELNTVPDSNPQNSPAVATNSEANTNWYGSGSTLADLLTATYPQPKHTNGISYASMQQWVTALRAASANTTTTPLSQGLPASSETSPAIVKYDVGTDGTVSISGSTTFYGLIIVKVPSTWDGSKPAISFSGTIALHGMVYLEIESFGTNSNASDPIININGGGHATQLTGAMIADVRSKGTFTGSAKTVAHINGGGKPSAAGIAYSAEGVNMVRTEIGTPTGSSFKTLAYKTTGALNITN